MPVDWKAVRGQFPALEDWTYLNTATFGQVPRRSVEAVACHFERRNRLACSDFLYWFDDADAVRGLSARLINCHADDVAFIPNASSALGLLLGGIDWKPGDRIVSLEQEFPNNLYHPALLGRLGVEFVETPWERFYDAITPRTRLVAISTANYSTGFLPPVEEIGAFLRERGVIFFLDWTQTLGALRFDVSRVRPDVFAVHAYKWLLSPNGAGFMYVDPEFRGRLQPAVVGWRSDKGWRNVDHLCQGAPEFKSTAEKYEGGMLTFSVLYGMGASFAMLLELGLDEIERRVLSLAGDARDRLRRLGARLRADELPYHDGPIITARFEGTDASLLARQLKERRILVSARHGNLRVAPHFYNNEEDLGRLEQALGEIL